MVAAPVDQVRTLYRTLLLYAAISLLILIAGLVEFVYFEPPGHHTGLKATIVGVYQYDPDQNTITGRVNAMPTREQINLPVQEQLIVELYSK